ncbi:hypothetical protein GMORB2_4558 [Geosmithia morbida]|uniref:DSC E3 ubiquitin ligase complex subunit A n=1 Tax=Geosmithia morbida TaxID=1094350 RepID=A0A9P4YPZ1_9HYPO|nr:uncharacterized protein GMORB2_4558 [Geosmithia morbida]KAF4119649.1 hypothetical protein GMORB2_4558 [Geosmithia morbida]
MPQQPQQSVAGIVLLLLMLWIIFPDAEYRGQSLLLSDVVHERLDRFWAALDVLNQTKWGDFNPTAASAVNAEGTGSWLNLTGYRQEDDFEWGDLGRFRDRSMELSRYVAPARAGEDDHWWDYAGRGGLPVWANASGTVHGNWVRKPGTFPRTPGSYNLSRSVPSMHWVGDKTEWARNMTGESGKMLVMLEGNRTVTEYRQLPAGEGTGRLGGGLIRNVKATIEVEDTHGSLLNWGMRLWGVHWPRQGVILMTTTSEKFEGIFGLPHLTPSADFFQSSRALLNQTLADTLRAKAKSMFYEQEVPWNSDLENPAYTTHPSPHCEFIMYAQVHPPSREDLGVASTLDTPEVAMSRILQGMESELQRPQGAPVGSIPELKMSAIIYSPDCGFFLETKGPPEFPPGEEQHLTGLKKEVHLHQVRSWVLAFALVLFAQVYVLKAQVTESSTPSTMARISFGTTVIMVLADTMTLMASMVWMASAGATLLPALVLLFAAFLSSVIGASFLAKIHEVQIPETREQRRDQRSTTAGSNTPASSSNRTTATPAPPPPPLDQPIIIPSDQDIDAEIAEVTGNAGGQGQQQPNGAQTFQATMGRYMLAGLGLSFLVISSTTWYPGVRSVFHNVCAMCYLSLWVPQIHRNVMRNCRRALRWRFVWGQSILRILPLAYFWLKSDNFLYAEPDRPALLAMCAWLWLQISVLYGQDVLGPRFGIPASWTPEAWDYHPVLSEDNLETGGLPIGLVVGGADDDGDDDGNGDDGHDPHAKAVRNIDCAICRELLEVPVVRAGQDASTVSATLARRTYMVTPCRHVFHTPCLEAWMRFRLQCPICREELPPL